MDIAWRKAAHSFWVEWGGRAGLVAKGVIYALIGVLALLVALGFGGRPKDRQGALRFIADQPLGEAILFALAAGFAGYAIWRFTQAFLDRDNEGDGLKGLAKRAGYFARGLLYAGLATVSLSIVAGLGGGGRNETQETDKVLDWPFGRALVFAAGFALLGAAAWNGFRALSKGYRKDMKTGQMSKEERRTLDALGYAGHLARMVVFGLIGFFLVRAAWQYDPQEAVGLDGALARVAQATHGEWLLAVVAGGLLAYGLFCFMQARYREV
jgi:uncharacterized protein DUF1206